MPDPRITFPLPDDVIRREKLRALVTSPLIWIPQIITVLTGLFLKWKWWVILLVMIGVFFVCALIWQARSARLGKKITKRIIKQSNEGQDTELLERVRQFEKDGMDGYAVTLGKFVQLKQQIEKELHEDGTAELSKGAQEVESMVDILCYGVADQFEAASEVERRLATLTSDKSEERAKLKAARKELLGQVIEGYKSLRKTRSQLAYLIKPASKIKAGVPKVDLNTIIHQLKEKDEIASNTRSRMKRDL